MKAQRFRHIGQAHGQQSLRAQAEESGLTVHNGLGAPQKGAPRSVQKLTLMPAVQLRGVDGP